MNREDIIRMANKAYGIDEEVKPFHPSALLHLEIFANLVASAERERIIAENAPEIEKINAHIKALEVAVAAERDKWSVSGRMCEHCLRKSHEITAKNEAD